MDAVTRAVNVLKKQSYDRKQGAAMLQQVHRSLINRGEGGRQATLESSFSSVSTPNFASKYSFFSIFRDLSDPYSFAPLHIQNF